MTHLPANVDALPPKRKAKNSIDPTDGMPREGVAAYTPPDPGSDVEAEAAFNAAHPEGEDPITQIERVGGKVKYGSATEDEDDEEDAKAPPAWALSSAVGLSEIPDAINYPGMLMSVTGRAGTVDIGFEVKVRGAGIPTLVAQIAEAVGGKMPHTAKFGGKLIGNGAVVKSYRGAADADGNAYCDVMVRVPQSAADNAGKLMRLLKRGAILALEPEQMTLNLTTRAE